MSTTAVLRDIIAAPAVPTFAEATRVWAKIGLLSFGGPVGQIALMHKELVEDRRWIGEQRFLHALNYCMLGRVSLPTSATRMLGRSGPSAQRAAPAPHSPCWPPTPMPCRSTSTKSRAASPKRPRRPAARPRRQAYHTRPQVRVPKNITLLFLPSCAPELNPVENVWQYLRGNWLSNSVFDSYDDIVEPACDAWRRLIARQRPSPRSDCELGSQRSVMRVVGI